MSKNKETKALLQDLAREMGTAPCAVCEQRRPIVAEGLCRECKERGTLYELFLHYKQGDDFACHLKAADGDVSQALRSWATAFLASFEACVELSELLEGQKLEATADTHMVGFFGLDEEARKRLREAVEKKLLCPEEI